MNPAQHKDHIKIFWFTLYLLIVVLWFMLYLYDPLHIFRLEPSWLEDWKYEYCNKEWIEDCEGKSFMHQNDKKYQVAGLINDKEFDSAILGTSLMAYSSASQASNLLWGEFINLSLDWWKLKERLAILEYANKKHPIQKVILTDFMMYDVDLNKQDWFRLYDDNPFNDILVYLNDKHLYCMLRRSTDADCIWTLAVIDAASTWNESKSDNLGIRNRKDWIIEKVLWMIELEEDKKSIFLQKKRINVGKELLSDAFISYPDTEFILVFPPISILRQAIIAQERPTTFKLENEFKKRLVEESSWFQSVTVYWFENRPVSWQMNEFRDHIHYSNNVYSRILKFISSNEDILTPDNIDPYITKLTGRAEEYDLKSTQKLLKELQKK